MMLHAGFINGSYVGLVAATFSEITSRIPGTENAFGAVVAGTSILVIAVGSYLIQHYLPRSINRTPARFRQGTQTVVR